MRLRQVKLAALFLAATSWATLSSVPVLADAGGQQVERLARQHIDDSGVTWYEHCHAGSICTASTSREPSPPRTAGGIPTLDMAPAAEVLDQAKSRGEITDTEYRRLKDQVK